MEQRILRHHVVQHWGCWFGKNFDGEDEENYFRKRRQAKVSIWIRLLFRNQFTLLLCQSISSLLSPSNKALHFWMLVTWTINSLLVFSKPLILPWKRATPEKQEEHRYTFTLIRWNSLDLVVHGIQNEPLELHATKENLSDVSCFLKLSTLWRSSWLTFNGKHS